MKTSFYTKRPDSYEAIQWDGKNTKDVQEFASSLSIQDTGSSTSLPVQTGTGAKEAKPGDYFVKDPQGNLSLVPKADFESEYDKSNSKPKDPTKDQPLSVAPGSGFPVAEAPPEADKGSLATTEADVVKSTEDKSPNTAKAKTPIKTEKK